MKKIKALLGMAIALAFVVNSGLAHAKEKNCCNSKKFSQENPLCDTMMDMCGTEVDINELGDYLVLPGELEAELEAESLDAEAKTTTTMSTVVYLPPIYSLPPIYTITSYPIFTPFVFADYTWFWTVDQSGNWGFLWWRGPNGNWQLVWYWAL